MNEWQEKNLKEFRLVCAALLGLCIVLTAQLLTASQSGTALTIAIYCFTVAIPLLAVQLLMIHSSYEFGVYLETWYEQAMVYVSVYVSFAGISSVFFHASKILGGLFLVVSFACIYAWLIYKRTLRSQAKSVSEQIEKKGDAAEQSAADDADRPRA